MMLVNTNEHESSRKGMIPCSCLPKMSGNMQELMQGSEVGGRRKLIRKFQHYGLVHPLWMSSDRETTQIALKIMLFELRYQKGSTTFCVQKSD